jgi:putative PEP-CTERM system TPR-repeat lipoprotein
MKNTQPTAVNCYLFAKNGTFSSNVNLKGIPWVMDYRSNTHRKYFRGLISRIGLVTLSSTLILTGCNQASKTYDEYLAESQKFIDQNEFKSAEISLKNAIQQSPDAPQARVELGKLYLEKGQAHIAAAELRKAVQLGANDVEAYTLLGDALLLKGDFSIILERFNPSATDADPLVAVKKSYLAEAYLGLKKFDNAKVMFDQALQSDPSNMRAKLGAAKVALVNGQTDLATDRVGKITEEEPNSALAWITLADVYRAQKQREKTIEAFEHAQSDDVNATPYERYIARRNLAYEYLHAQDLEKAKAALDKIPKDFQQQSKIDPMVNYVKAFLAYDQKDMAKAKEFAEKVQPPQAYPFILMLLGHANLDAGNFEQAEAQLSIFHKMYPNHPTGNRLLAMAQIQLNNLDDAKESLERTVKAQGDRVDPSVLALLANVNLKEGKAEEGERLFKQAIELAPENDALKFGLAKSMFMQSNSEEAINELASIQDNERNQALATLAIAEAEARKGNFEEALAKLDSLPKELDNSPLVPSFKGTIYLMMKDQEMAKKLFNDALEKQPDYLPAIRQLAYIDAFDGELDKTLERLKSAYEAKPDSYMLSVDYAKALVEDKQTDKAIKVLEDAISLNPNRFEAKLYLAQLQLILGRPAATLGILNALESGAPADAWVLTGKARVQLDEWVTAIDAFRKADQINQSADTSLLLYQALLKNNQSVKADALLNERYELYPESEPLNIIMANKLMASGRLDELDSVLAKMKDINPESGAYHSLLAKRMTLGDESEVESKLKNAFSETDQIAYASTLLAWMKNHNEKSEARAYIEDHLNHPTRADYFYTLMGSVNLEDGDEKGALNAFEQAIEKNGNNVIALNNAAWLMKDSNPKKARELINRALELAPSNPDVKDTSEKIKQL